MLSLARLCAVAAWVCLVASAAPATALEFDLDGNAGAGLLGGNENHAVVLPGSGGEIGAGILYDTDTNVLTLDIGWGSGNGFTDLSGDALAGHIHGPTSSAPGGYSEDAGVLVTLSALPGWDASASSGGFSGTVVLTDTQEGYLLANQLYINVHTLLNSNGEIRGQLVPEPSTGLLVGLGLAWVGARRRAKARP